MSATTAGTIRRPLRTSEWRHALRLALAVVAAYGLSSALGLPENFWAVMSALIVVRPTTGSTLGAGWDRVRGALFGTLLGLAGAWFHYSAIGTDAVTLAIVTVIAFASALVPALRSAPLSALIVLTAGSIAGHSALEVAELRAVEIAIGVACGMAVSLLAFVAHARAAFDAACASWLVAAARDTREALTRVDVENPEVRERRTEATREALRELAVLAIGADREDRLMRFARRARMVELPLRKAQARLMGRVSSDLVALLRVIVNAPEPIGPAERRIVADAVCRALESAAELLSVRGRLDLTALRSLSSNDATRPWLAPSAKLLLQDLVQLRRLVTPDRESRGPGASGASA